MTKTKTKTTISTEARPYRDPPRDCDRCARLAAYLARQRAAEPDWWNAPAPAFGPLSARLLVVGLAPGLRGANRTGRPFTGDAAGDLLYPTLLRFGFAEGAYGADPGDGLTLKDARITNAVRCAPPENKPTGAEVNACRAFLVDELAAMERLEAIVSLGKTSWDSCLRALGLKVAAHPFAHLAEAEAELGGRKLTLIASYHCSRYNTQTGRLTTPMFESVFARARDLLTSRG